MAKLIRFGGGDGLDADRIVRWDSEAKLTVWLSEGPPLVLDPASQQGKNLLAWLVANSADAKIPPPPKP